MQHYHKDADGLCTQLRRSVPKQGKQDFSIDCKAFETAGWVIKKEDLQVRHRELADSGWHDGRERKCLRDFRYQVLALTKRNGLDLAQFSVTMQLLSNHYYLLCPGLVEHL